MNDAVSESSRKRSLCQTIKDTLLLPLFYLNYISKHNWINRNKIWVGLKGYIVVRARTCLWWKTRHCAHFLHTFKVIRIFLFSSPNTFYMFYIVIWCRILKIGDSFGVFEPISCDAFVLTRLDPLAIVLYLLLSFWSHIWYHIYNFHWDQVAEVSVVMVEACARTSLHR